MATELDRLRHEALEVLKPVCVSLMLECTKSNIADYISALAKVKREIVQEIQQYVLFPLQNAIHRKNMSESSFLAICQGLDAILDKTVIQTTRTFMDIFDPLVIYLASSSNPREVSALSEETKATAVKTLSSLLKSSSESVLNDLYCLTYLPVIGQLVTLLLSMAEMERSRSLQTASMECILVLLQLESKYGLTKAVHLGNFFALCLPAVTMTMNRIITGDQKQGSDVIRKAMTLWSRIVRLVMSDVNLEKAKGKPSLKTTHGLAVHEDKLKKLKVERNEEWVKNTSSKLKILIDQIRKLGSHSNWRVRYSLAELSENILLHCNKSLNESIPKVLESLVALINDEYEKVASKAFSALQTYSNGQAGSPGERSLREILEDNIHDLATSLPRQIRMCDEENKLPLINLLKGYITLLGPNIKCVVNSSGHLRHLALALVQILELDSSDSKILEERASLLDYEAETFQAESHSVWKPKKNFRHFRDDAILTGLTSVCRLLGKYGNLFMLVDSFLDLYHESAVYKLASIFIINEIVFGAGQNNEEGVNSGRSDSTSLSENSLSHIQDVVRMLLDEYVCTVNLRASHSSSTHTVSPSSPSSFLDSTLNMALQTSHEMSSSIANHNREILLSCLFMEGVGNFAMILGQDFRIHLIQTLYPLVENLGHENIHISSTAYLTLVHICTACGYRSIDSLIQDNADYLISSVSLRLRHFHQNQRTPRLLCVMLRYCSQDLLPMVDHSIGEILDTLDDHYTDDLVMFMPVLLELTSAIGRWFPSIPQTPCKNKETDEITRPLVDCLVEYVKLKRTAECDLTDEEFEQDLKKERTLEDVQQDFHKLNQEREQEKENQTEDLEDEDEKKKECPKHVQVVKEVLARIKNLLSSHNPRVRVQSLEVAAQGLRDLADHEGELLPQIHQLWSGFYPRFHSEETFVVIKALQMLGVMADVGGSFLQHRAMKDVIPGLRQYMEKQAKISYDSRSTYENTSNFKLQSAILDTLGPLAERLELNDNNLDSVAKICLPYLSDHQPVKLQKVCVSAFSSFIALDSNAMWLVLCQAYCPIQYQLPGSEFTPLPESFQPQNENSFTKNVKEIFQRHYSS